MIRIRPKTVDAIIEAGFTVFAADPAASLSDIAKTAGIGRATLHRHFAGRKELMVALAKTAFDELEEAVQEATVDAQTYTEGLRLALDAMIPLANRQLFLANEGLEKEPEIATALERGKEELADDFNHAKSEGTFAATVPTSWLVQAYENLIYAAWTMVEDGEATPRQASELTWRTLTSGLSGDTT